MQRHRGGLFALCCATLLLLTAPALAETIKIVVPFAAGGPVDQLARILANGLGPKLDANVIVDDRGGAGGAIASEYVAHAAPDGKTILLASLGSQVLSPILKPPTSYDPVKSFEPVMLVGVVPSLLVVNKDLGVASLPQLINKAKVQKLTYGSAGPGTTMNIAVEMLNAAAGVKITHVPYRGAAPAINDLLGGHVDMLNADLASSAAAGQSRLGQGARLVRRAALAAVAGFADNRRARPAKRGDAKLVRRAVARRDAERRA